MRGDLKIEMGKVRVNDHDTKAAEEGETTDKIVNNDALEQLFKEVNLKYEKALKVLAKTERR